MAFTVRIDTAYNLELAETLKTDAVTVDAKDAGLMSETLRALGTIMRIWTIHWKSLSGGV